MPSMPCCNNGIAAAAAAVELDSGKVHKVITTTTTTSITTTTTTVSPPPSPPPPPAWIPPPSRTPDEPDCSSSRNSSVSSVSGGSSSSSKLARFLSIALMGFIMSLACAMLSVFYVVVTMAAKISCVLYCYTADCHSPIFATLLQTISRLAYIVHEVTKPVFDICDEVYGHFRILFQARLLLKQ